MFRLKIRAIGHPTEPWQKEAVDSYVHRSKTASLIEVIELPEGQKGSAKPDPVKTAKIEAESLRKGIPEDAFVVALDETGKELDSPTFAAKLLEWGANGRTVVFLIGGSWGLDPSVRDRADVVLSLGKLTLPHNLARIVLAEQLYRAGAIVQGKTYHK